MDLNEISIDPIRVEQGAWIDTGLGDIRVKMRGSNNSDWLALYIKLDAAIPNIMRKQTAKFIAERERIESECIVQAGLLDWQGITEGGEPLPFSVENARRLIFDPKYKAFRSVCKYVADRIATESDLALADAIKN
jgi:hypothetical protein